MYSDDNAARVAERLRDLDVERFHGGEPDKEERSAVRRMLDFYDNPEAWESDAPAVMLDGDGENTDYAARILECLYTIEAETTDLKHGDGSHALLRSAYEQIGKIIWESVEAHAGRYYR